MQNSMKKKIKKAEIKRKEAQQRKNINISMVNGIH